MSELFDEGEELTIHCADGRGQPVAFSSLPRAAVLLITNHSDHIVALGQTAHLTGTVIVLEDELGHPFRLFTEESWKEDLRSRIREFYDDSLAAAVSLYRSGEAERIEDYADELQGGYSEDYGRYVLNFRINSGLQLLNPFWWLGLVLGIFDGNEEFRSAFVFPPLQKDLAPAPVATQAKDEFFEEIDRNIDATRGLMAAARSDCLDKAKRLRLTDVVPMMLTGTFPAINILPGRQMRVYVPFEELAEYPSKLYLRVFDLVTNHDAAGLPTRRSSFSFELRRVDSPVLESSVGPTI